MKYPAIELVKYGNADTAFRKVEKPIEKPQKNEVQIQVERFGLNYADVMARKGLYNEAPPLPCVLGYEVVGKVVDKGVNVPNDLLGKRVVAFTRFGGYAKRVNTQHHGVVSIEDYDGNQALCLATQYVTAYYMSHVATSIFEGDNVLIHNAAGGVGTALIQLLRDKNVRLIGKTSQTEKYDYLKEQGIHEIVNYKTADYGRKVRSILGDDFLDVSFNPVGGASFKKDWKLLGQNGRMVLFGGSALSKKWGILSQLNFVRKMGIIIPIGTMMQSKSLIGVNMLKVGDHKPAVLKHCLSTVVKLAKEGKINPQVGGVFSADHIDEAHAFLSSGNSTGKIVVEW